jgi:hypothetical protein
MIEVRVPFLSRIQALDLDGHRIRSEVASRFSWNKIGLAYAKILAAVERDGLHSGNSRSKNAAGRILEQPL